MFKQIVVLLLVPVTLASCPNREKEQQKIVAEIERLDLLRKKAKEFVLEHEAALSAKQSEFTKRATDLTMAGVEYGEVVKRLETDLARAIDHQPHRVDLLKKRLASARKAYEYNQNRMQEHLSGIKQILALSKDLKSSQAIYDSLNTLHTIEVGKLAKFGSEQ